MHTYSNKGIENDLTIQNLNIYIQNKSI